MHLPFASRAFSFHVVFSSHLASFLLSLFYILNKMPLIWKSVSLGLYLLPKGDSKFIIHPHIIN